MSSYTLMSQEELEAEFSKVKKEYANLTTLGLHLDMSRGKPSVEQIDLSKRMFDLVGNDLGFKNKDGIECRNYGGLDGLRELKELFAQILGLRSSQIIVGGNSSLNMMYDTVSQAMTHGFGGQPWMKQGEIKFICPVPGYDRHFAITEHFGIKMVQVNNNQDGPDMDAIEELIKDPSVKGMWCVPKYSNPEGITYSDEVVKRLANMKPAAKDFRIFWDDAYAIHDLYDEGDTLLNIYDECVKAGNPDLAIIFTSTSKITYPGAGVAVEAASPNNVELIKKRLQCQTIGPDKLSQLRHARMFKNVNDVKAHMKKHAEILRPKFESVLAEMDKQLDGLGIASWNRPKGGYFISLNVMNGCAKRVEELCAGAGMILTKVGATYPYGYDENDSNIRIAPSFPPVEEIKKASNVLCVSVKYAVLEKLLREK